MCVSQSFETRLTEPPRFSHGKDVGSVSHGEQPGANSLGIQSSTLFK